MSDLNAEYERAFRFYQDAFRRGDIDAIVKRLKESQRRWAAERVARRRAHNDGSVAPWQVCCAGCEEWIDIRDVASKQPDGRMFCLTCRLR